MRSKWFILTALIALPGTALAGLYESEAADFRITEVVDGLEHPWAVAFLPGGDLLVTERPGRLLRLDPEGDERAAVDGLPEITAERQGGLLDVVLHPEYADNGWLYLSYVAADDAGDQTTHVSRFRLDGTRLTDREDLFVATPFTSGGRHFGSRLAFDGDHHLYITVGDRGDRDRAQDPQQHIGKTVRLTDDGAIPGDNPFVAVDDAAPGLYTLGHRNAQGLARHPDTGAMWLHEHGPRGGDEINILEAGENYGWPETTFGREYFGPRIGPEPPVDGFRPPIHHWTPSIAPSGMAFYTGDAFPEWQGDLFVGALAGTHLERLELDGDEVVHSETLLDHRSQRIRDVRQGPDGALYLLVDSGSAPLLRIAPAQ